MKYAWLILLWTGFGISHSYLISEGFEGWLRKVSGKYYAYYRLIYNLVALASFVPLLSFTKRMDTYEIIRINPIAQIILLSLSAIVLVWAFITFDPLEFMGVRQVLPTSDNVQPDKGSMPVKTGLYSIVRHPMYFATLVFMWSLNSTLAEIIMKAILTIYIVIGSKLEERKLVKEFGPSYQEYIKEVPMLIPLLYRRKI